MIKQITSLVVAVFVLVLSGNQSVQADHPTEGKLAPPIQLKTVDGQQFTLKQVEAQVIVLDFWATWCGPCRMGLPLLQQFYDWARENKQPVAVLTINLREKPQDVRAYWKKENFDMPVLMDTDGHVGQSYGIRGIPHTVVIHKGRIAHVHVGYSPAMAEMLKAEVEKLLDENNTGQ